MKPVICPYCNKQAKWVENSVIYGKRFGKSYMCWYCNDCNAYVGCHLNSKKPLGTLANGATRKMRIHAHGIIDKLWKEKTVSRKKVFKITFTYWDGKEECFNYYSTNILAQTAEEAVQNAKDDLSKKDQKTCVVESVDFLVTID